MHERGLRVLIAPDKFKGTLTAAEAAEAMQMGWRRVRPRDKIQLHPISDGGDGFGEILGTTLGAKPQMVRTVDAAHQPCLSRWWWRTKHRTAFIDSAAVIGLAMLPARRFHPFDLDTLGLGTVLKAAAKKGARKCIIGIGGSATNDAGFGLALSLGWRFMDNGGNAISRWTDLNRVAEIQQPRKKLQIAEIIVAVDVANLLLGPRGATRVYGPQKGLRSEEFPTAEAALRQMAAILRKHTGEDAARIPGSGAAGGLGFGLAAFLGARLMPGFALFANLSRLEQKLARTDLVLTGEGRLDTSSLMGKGVGELARFCKRARKPCLALAGCVTNRRKVSREFARVIEMTELVSEREANEQAWISLSLASEQMARTIKSLAGVSGRNAAVVKSAKKKAAPKTG